MGGGGRAFYWRVRLIFGKNLRLKMKNFASENAVPEGMWHQGEAISLQVLSACYQEILTTIVPSNFKIISLHTGWGSEVRLPCRNLPLDNRNPLRGLVCNMGPKGLSKVSKMGAYMISFFYFYPLDNGSNSHQLLALTHPFADLLNFLCHNGG